LDLLVPHLIAARGVHPPELVPFGGGHVIGDGRLGGLRCDDHAQVHSDAMRRVDQTQL
jgi:hypothetical protein